METLVILAALAVGIYLFFKGNTKRGAETVRAYVFLSAVKRGRSLDEANQYANYDVANGPMSLILAAKEHAKVVYGGKQLPMIADARRLGMGRATAIPNGSQPLDLFASPTVTFEDYESAFFDEVKRLDPKLVVNGLHWVELVTDDGTRRAYADGVTPQRLAQLFVREAKPPLPWEVE